MEIKNIVYDLDGTLVKFNTFKLWIIISILMPILSLNFIELYKVISLVIQRTLKKKNRVEFKEELLNLQLGKRKWNFLGGLYAKFLYKFTVQKVILLDKEGNNFILATAAPDIYILPFAKLMKCFDVTLCTVISDGKMVEMFSSFKKERVLDVCGKKPDIFFTDHADDLPLALITRKTYFINPSAASLEKIKSVKSDFDYEISYL